MSSSGASITIRRHTTVPKVCDDPSTSGITTEVSEMQYTEQVNKEISRLPVYFFLIVFCI